MRPPRPSVPNWVLALAVVASALGAIAYVALGDAASGDASSDDAAVSASQATMAAPPSDDPAPEPIPTH
jgi:hypothetical protein